MDDFVPRMSEELIQRQYLNSNTPLALCYAMRAYLQKGMWEDQGDDRDSSKPPADIETDKNFVEFWPTRRGDPPGVLVKYNVVYTASSICEYVTM